METGGGLELEPPMSVDEFRAALKPITDALPGGMAEPYTEMALETVSEDKRALFIEINIQRLANTKSSSLDT